MDAIFPVAASKEALEDGDRLTPRFDDQGLIGCIAVRCGTGARQITVWC